MLETFSLQTFSGHVNETFTVTPAEGVPVELRLVEATSLGESPGPGGRAPFSLIFAGPADTPLPQCAIPMRHDAIGAFELFIVPIQPDGSGPRYQAIFN